jgi:Predicted RNA-binding protein homologous to eukaryotic snRNP
MDLPPRDRPSAQGMDVTTVRAVVSDLRRRLLPSRFEKAQQPDSHSLQLGFRTLTGMVWLELSWQADLPRLVQIPPPRRQGGGSTLAQQSSTACDNWLSCRSSNRVSSGW